MRCMVKSTTTSWQIDVVAPSTVVESLRIETALSVSKIKEALIKGAVWIKRNRDGRAEKARRIRRAKNSVRAGDQLFMYYNPQILAQTIDQPKLIEDLGHYSVWDKPAGMLCEGTRWSDHCALTRVASTKLLNNRACFLVHRLDKMTSGLILLAHSKKAAQLLSRLFAERMVEKHYRALVYTQFFENLREALPMRIELPIDGKSAISLITEIRPVHRLLNGSMSAIAENQFHGMSEFDVQIETGRTHQIRRHLQSIGSPVVGDRLYGRRNTDNDELLDLQLRAYSLSFIDPFDQLRRNWNLK